MSTPSAGIGPDIPRQPDPGPIDLDSLQPGAVPADELDALVEQILGAKPRPIDWTRLSGPPADEAREALAEWVRWLVTHYAIDPREVPPCWAEHGDLFEELSALHTAHRAAFDPAGPPIGPADWHTMLANTRARLQMAVAGTGCRVGRHRAPTAPEWASGHATTGTMP